MANEDNIINAQDVHERIISTADALSAIRSGEIVALEGSGTPVLIGPRTLVKVNTNIGCSRIKEIDVEYAKIDQIGHSGYGPDAIIQLTIVRRPEPLHLRRLSLLP